MKDSIEELIETYTRRIKTLDEMNAQATEHTTKVRLATKRTVFTDVIRDLQLLLKDEQDTA